LDPRGLHEALVRSGGKRYLAAFDDRLVPVLGSALRTAVAAGYTLADVEHMGRWYAAGGEAWRGEIGASYFARNGNLVEALERARRWSVGQSILSAVPRASAQPADHGPRVEPFAPEPPIPIDQRAGAAELEFAAQFLGYKAPP
jgi:hypothetical protein